MRSAQAIGSILVFILLASAAVFAVEGIEGAVVPPGQILIQYERNMGAVEFGSLCSRLSELGFGFVRHYARSCVLKVQVPCGDDSESAIAKALGVPGVRHAETPFACFACGKPNDEWYWLQWNLRQIGYEQAWDALLKDAAFTDPAVIAVLDTGVAYEDYTDSKYHYERAPDLVQTEFVAGYDAINDDYHANDDNGHGTFVCGVIAQSTNKVIGCASMAFGCKIMPVKVLGEFQTGDTASLVEGIYYAVDNGADVLNISLGFSWYFSRSEILSDAVAHAAQSGVVIIASAGNSALPYVKFPAAYNECLAVGASIFKNDPNDVSKASYSNYGVALDLMAPGGNFRDENKDLYPDAILAQSFDGGRPSGCWDLWWAAGTSAAAGQVSAIAGVLISLGLDREQVLAVLKGTASNVAWVPGQSSLAAVKEFDCKTGYGLVNVHKALQCALTGVTPQFPEYQVSISNWTEVLSDGKRRGVADVSVSQKLFWSGLTSYWPVKDVTVYGYWKGSAVGADSKKTDDKGKSKFESEKTSEQNPRFEFVITNTVKGGKDFSASLVTCGDVTTGDALIVRPLRSTGGALDSELYSPWLTGPDQGIY